jgi:excisionase family DNA binding protein
MFTEIRDHTHVTFVSQEMDKLKEVRAGRYADKWDVPIYTYAEAAYYLGLHRGTLRTWVIGRTIPYMGELRRLEPIIKAADVRSGLMSFYNLAEAHILAASRYKHGVPFRNISATLFFTCKTGILRLIRCYRKSFTQTALTYS